VRAAAPGAEGRPHADIAALVKARGRAVLVTVSTIVLGDSGSGAAAIHFLSPVTDQGRKTEMLRQILKRLSASLDALPIADGEAGVGLSTASKTGSGLPALSRREEQVLRAVATGQSTHGMAEALGVSSFTIRTHVRSLLRKTGLHSRVQLALFAVRHGLD
jgi:DNA-binding CsgD family transcriptional regulator